MTSTVNNGTFTLAGLTGATVQGTQYLDTGIVRVGNGAATTLNDGLTAMAACEFLELQIGNANSAINFTDVALRITSGVDNAFGTNSLLGAAGTGVSMLLERCLVYSPNSRLIMRGTGHNIVIRDAVLNIVGLALFGANTVIDNVTISGMGSAVSSGLGIRNTYADPISGLIIKDSTNGFNLFGSSVGVVENGRISNTTHHFYAQVDASTSWTGRLDGINLESNWSFYWARPSGFQTFSGSVRRMNTFNLAIIDASNAAVEDVGVYIRDALDNVFTNSLTDSSGVIPQLQLIRNVYTFGGTFNSTITTNVSRLPYLKRYRKYELVFIEDLTFEFSSAITEVTKTAANPFVTAADATAALAVTNPTTANQTYDHHQATYAGETFRQRAVALSTTDGVTLTLNCNVTINSSLTEISYTPATPAISVSALTAGTFGLLQLGPSRTIDLVQAATYSAPLAIPATGIVTVADGTSNLTTWTFANGADINLRSGATDSEVQVAATEIAKITPGSGVTLTSPPSVVSVGVDGPSDYYVVVIQSGSRINTSDTGLQSGTYEFSTSLTGSAVVRIRRQGWSDFQTTITLSGGTIPVGGRLVQEMDALGDPLYSGSTSSLISVVIDAADANHKIDWATNGGATAQLIYDEVQDAKVSSLGMVEQNLQASFVRVEPFLSAIFLPEQVKFRNATPANQNCRFIGFASQAAGLLIDDGSGNGTIQIVSSLGQTQQQTRDALLLAPTVGAMVEAGSVDDLIGDISAGSGLTAQQVRDSLKLAPSAGSPAAGSVDADLDAIQGATFDTATDSLEALRNRGDAAWVTGSGSGLDAAGVRAAVGLAAANLDTQLGAIDTVVDGIAVQTTRVDGLIEDSSGNRFTAKALEEGPAGGGGGDATAANQTTIINALAVVDTVVDAILVDTTEIGAAGTGLTNIPTIANVTTVGTVTNAVTTTVTPLDATATQNAAAAALTVYDPPTRAELTSDIGTVTTAISDVPTTAEFEARTIPSADYFVVGDYTAPANSDITAIKAKTDQLAFTIANQVDSNALSGAAGGGDDAATIYSYFTASTRPDPFKANVSALLTGTAYTASLPANFADLSITDTTGLVTTSNPGGGGATAAQVWEYSGGDRALSGAQATAIGAISNIPTTPFLSNDARLSNLDAAISSRSTFNPANTSVTVSDKTGFSLSSSGIQAIWDALTSVLSANGSIGKFIVDQLNTLTGRNNPLNSTDTQSAAAAAIAAADLYDGSDTPGTVTLLGRITQAPLDADGAELAVSNALGDYGVPTWTQVQSVGFTSDRNGALVAVDAKVDLLFKRQGLENGVTATVKSAESGTPGYLTTSDDAIDQVLTKNVDGSVTISNA